METKQHGELCAKVAERERDLEFGSLLVCNLRPRISEGHLLLVNLNHDNRIKEQQA